MRILENVLTIFFTMKFIDKPNIKIYNYSSKHKLGKTDSTLKGKSNYTLRKKISVAMCNTFLESFPQSDEFHTMFKSSKKKDDLADSLLQGLSYIKSFDMESLKTNIVNL
jgi:hypothetical protein